MGTAGLGGPEGVEGGEGGPRPGAGRGLGGAGRRAGPSGAHRRLSRSMKSPAVVGVLCTDSQGLNLGCEYPSAAGPGLHSGVGLGTPA